MQQEQKTVFISYRRKPASYIARAIFENLRAHGYDVFMDVENIGAGEFGTIIDNQIKARAHFLIILTTGTVARFDEEKDWLRHEIEYAMEQKRNIVPLMIDGFTFNKTAKRYLTGDLAALSRLNGLPVRHEDFEYAMDKLRTRFLRTPEYVETEPTPPAEQAEVERKIEETAALPPPTKAELSAEDYFNRALALQYKGDLDSAITDYGEAIRLDPQYPEIYNNRAIARDNKGDLDGAMADYGEAIRLNPQDADAYYNRGITRDAQGDLDGAMADYGEAIRLNPQDAGAYNNRGIARQTQGDLDGAVADYGEAIRLNPQYAKAYYNRGLARQALGDLDGAVADYDEAIRLNPRYAKAYYNRGFARQAQGDLDGAVADYDEEIQLNPQDANAYYNRGLARQAQGDLDGAIADYQMYLDLGGGKRDGDQAEIEERIRELRKQLKS